jgi:hypothetical protein
LTSKPGRRSVSQEGGSYAQRIPVFGVGRGNRGNSQLDNRGHFEPAIVPAEIVRLISRLCVSKTLATGRGEKKMKDWHFVAMGAGAYVLGRIIASAVKSYLGFSM